MTRALHRFSLCVLLPGWASAGLLLALYPLFPRFLDRYQFVPFVLGMVFLGLPHGAQDHLVVPRLRGERVRLAFLPKFMAGYGALVALYLVFWRISPVAALIVFLLLSLLHWGQGDAYALSAFANVQPAPTLAGRGLVWVVRGALPIALSSLAFPDVFARVAGGLTGWYGTRNALHLTGEMRAAGFAVIGFLIALYALQSWHSNKRTPAFWLDAGEVALLILLFWRVPPILAVGVYFCAWHALRHVGRLVLIDPAARADVERGQVARAFGRAARDSFPLTLVSLVMLAGLFFALPHRALSLESTTYLYLSLVAALTFPHFLLVIWMDRHAQVLRAP